MKTGGCKFGIAAVLLAALAMGIWQKAAEGQPASQTIPVGYATNFTSVAYFEPPNEQVVKLRVSCAEESPLPNALYDVKTLKIEYFNTDRKLQAVAEAPQCTYAREDQVAYSPGRLKLTSGDGRFHTEGDGFLFREDESWLMISNHVHSVIRVNMKQLTRL
jgi:hypothetical protein